MSVNILRSDAVAAWDWHEPSAGTCVALVPLDVMIARIEAVRAVEGFDGREQAWCAFTPRLPPQRCRIGFRLGPILPQYQYDHPRDEQGRYRRSA